MLRVERRGSTLVWSIARPQAKNALDRATLQALRAAIHDASQDASVRAVVLTGEGDTFASGGDLRELRHATSEVDAETLAEAGRGVCDGIMQLPVPVIAALPGAAIGGGAELAVACDVRIADERATICFKHARMGVTTAWGILRKLVATVGHATAARLLYTAYAVHAKQARDLGLVDAVSANGACVGTALAWALDIAQASPAAVAQMKSLLRESLSMDGEALRTRERERFVATWTGEDHREAVEAFFESRAPIWKGR
jgi:enoyl-CoA hydratase